ncbi:MAG TPA: amino acid ABC transporter ATP-binding protein [Ramlibacter sp.]|nr:amino acid ABC transporter ATP-binding protein [Ramlibacter sp.]
MALVEIRQVSKRFGPLEVLKGVSLDVEAGQVVCLMGSSGSGKTTLLRCINHLEKIDGGSIRVDGEMIGYRQGKGTRLLEESDRATSAKRARVGMVFQRFNLFPHLTSVGNVCEAPIHVRGDDPRAARERAHELLARVGLADKAEQYPHQLSGGQQQRVAIARALAMDPKLMLFDEPTSALDPELVGEVLEVMRDLAAKGMTMIAVTHELAFARDAADRVVMMDDGLIVEDAAPALFFSAPSHARSQAFLSRMR